MKLSHTAGSILKVNCTAKEEPKGSVSVHRQLLHFLNKAKSETAHETFCSLVSSFNVCVCVGGCFVCTCVLCTMFTPGAQQGQKTVLGSQDGSEMAVSHHVGSGIKPGPLEEKKPVHLTTAPSPQLTFPVLKLKFDSGFLTTTGDKTQSTFFFLLLLSLSSS